METNITTLFGFSGAIASAVVAVIAFLKTQVWPIFALKSRDWYPVFNNIVTVVLALGMSFGGMIVTDFRPHEYAICGLVAYLSAVGGYETIVNLLRSFFLKSKKF